MKPFVLYVAACALFTAATTKASAAPAASWPQFRGDNADGIGVKARPPINVGPTNGVLWRVEAPWSPSSPCVWGDSIFLTTFADGQLQTRCHDRRTGNLLWTQGLKVEKLE